VTPGGAGLRALPSGVSSPLGTRALALNGLGAFVSSQDSLDEGRLVMTGSFALLRQLGDVARGARVLYNLAPIAINQGTSPVRMPSMGNRWWWRDAWAVPGGT
jgi:hypothetical protein